MGNYESDKAFYMHVQLIGKNMTDFLEYISGYKNSSFAKNKKKEGFRDYWDFEISSESSFEIEIKNYFKKLIFFDKNRKSGIKECLIVRIEDIKTPKTKIIFEEMSKLSDTYYMPIVLFLTEKETCEKVIVNSEYTEIDPRLVNTYPYPLEMDNKEKKEKFMNILYRFCNILNELGDRFTVGKGENKEDIDLIENYFPFNVNIACIGRFRQGKSTGVNVILKEYKAKESNRGTTQTKHLTFYQVSNYPVRVLDIPGFENVQTVKDAVEKFKQCGERINKIKDNLHVVLYFLSFLEKSAFLDLEYPMFEEMTKHKNSKIIYVITHSNENEKMREKFLGDINLRLKEVIQRRRKYLAKKKEAEKKKVENLSEINNIPIVDEYPFFNLNDINVEVENEDEFEEEIYDFENDEVYQKMKVDNDNYVFVNFHKNVYYNIPIFGKDVLFKKIKEAFINSEDYKTCSKQLDEGTLNKKIEKLKEEAKDAVLSNKIWGGVVGILPGVDWALQKFVIKKNAAKKIGTIFGIDVKFLNEEEEEEEKKKKEEKKEESTIKRTETKKADYILEGMDEENLELKVDGDKITEESDSHIAGRVVSNVAEGGSVIGGVASVGTGIARAALAVGETTTTVEAAATGLVFAAGTGLKVLGAGLFVFGAAVGAGVGGYLTHKHCEEMIEKFAEYYRKNANSIASSYEKAKNYFEKVD